MKALISICLFSACSIPFMMLYADAAEHVVFEYTFETVSSVNTKGPLQAWICIGPENKEYNVGASGRWHCRALEASWGR